MDRTFKGERVVLDDGSTEFVNCTFDGCELVITAQRPLALGNCQIMANCTLSFESHAAGTLEALSLLYPALGGKDGVIEQLLQTIRTAETTKWQT